LTAEDIMMQEAREKVELFRHYYFVNYRSFEQDVGSDDYMEPVNMYVVVFREGIISFHFSQTPHPANVRRRIRQLSDYLFVTTDWISYALIDDVTDAFAPLIRSIEDQVDALDDMILSFDGSEGRSHADMLRQTGDCRKNVMQLYRLLGTKADVIKGFAKRCNEQWEIAPKSEIGMYLGDIQDHIVTMTGNLSHYEKWVSLGRDESNIHSILSRAHSNYLAQINIHMTERAERTNDVLGKLTVLGTIVLPMNIVTGLWGMNTRVPGEKADDGDLRWFYCITGGLLMGGLLCYLVARRTLGVV
jgi:magnesium transporter